MTGQGSTTLAGYFYPRPPRGGRRSAMVSTIAPPRFLSTPSARRATSKVYTLDIAHSISIHALREEGDWHPWFVVCFSHISIHALREEGDAPSSVPCDKLFRFLSTPSARRATQHVCMVIYRHNISIHALREEGDKSYRLVHVVELLFLSTPSARRATHRAAAGRLGQAISIHALREEGDRMALPGLQPSGISIHALREEGDRSGCRWRNLSALFLSTPSARRATNSEI